MPLPEPIARAGGLLRVFWSRHIMVKCQKSIICVLEGIFIGVGNTIVVCRHTSLQIVRLGYQEYKSEFWVI